VERRRTFIFLVGMSNWVYLPLPITEALYGAEGIQTVLLVNIGGQVVLWTIIVGSLRGGTSGREMFRNLFVHQGLWATALGIGLALTAPWLKECLDAGGAQATAGELAAKALLQPLDLISRITVPLSLVVIGAQLEDAELEDEAREKAQGREKVGPLPRFDRGVARVLVARLLVAPVVFVAFIWALRRGGAVMLTNPIQACYIMAAMPSAVSCGMFVERFGGDSSLAARAVLYTTLVALLSVPALLALISTLGF
jgi:predicted permease